MAGAAGCGYPSGTRGAIGQPGPSWRVGDAVAQTMHCILSCRWTCPASRRAGTTVPMLSTVPTITPTPPPAPRNLEDDYRLYLHALRQATRVVLGVEAAPPRDDGAERQVLPVGDPPQP